MVIKQPSPERRQPLERCLGLAILPQYPHGNNDSGLAEGLQDSLAVTCSRFVDSPSQLAQFLIEELIATSVNLDFAIHA